MRNFIISLPFFICDKATPWNMTESCWGVNMNKFPTSKFSNLNVSSEKINSHIYLITLSDLMVLLCVFFSVLLSISSFNRDRLT